MPIFKIRVTRTYQCYENATTEVEAETPEAALAIARQEELDGDLSDLWHEYDGGADADSYEWTVQDLNNKVLLTSEGTNDFPGEFE